VSLLLLSAGTRVRTPAPLNHRVYADRHGIDYLFDATPAPLPSVFLYKAEAVKRALQHYEWVFWIDDDAFVTNLDFDIRSFVSDGADLVLCASPVNPDGGWTFVSFGQFLVRRTSATTALLDATLSTELREVEAWWDPTQYGLFTNSDQDALVYQLARDDVPWSGRWRRLEWSAFNSRPYHYRHRLDEHALCHFVVPGPSSKMELIREFAERMGTTTALVDAELLEPYGPFISNSELAELLGPPWSQSTAPRVDDSRQTARPPRTTRWRELIRRRAR
jgi:hypothetical protein